MTPPEMMFGYTYHGLMIPPFPGKMLILGWGEGSIAWLTRKVWGEEFPIHGVDLKAPEQPWTEIMARASKNTTHIICKAEDFVKSAEPYDIVAVDLYVGKEIPGFVFQDSFISDLRRITRKLLIVNATFKEWTDFEPFEKYFAIDAVKKVNRDKVATFNPKRIEMKEAK